MNIEITPFTIWLFTRLKYINILIGFSIIISMAITFSFFVVYHCINKTGLFFFAFFIIIGIITPSQKEVVAMYIIPKIANSEYAHRIGEKGLNSIENFLDYTNNILKKEKVKK